MFKYLLLFIWMAAILTGCGPNDTPRGVTMEFVGSVIEDDSLAIEQLLDLDLMVQRRMLVIPPTDSTQTHAYFRDTIMRNLTGDGGTRALWMDMRLVVGDEKVDGDTAYVELTSMDQDTGYIQYLTVHLYKGAGGWRVYQFL
ncbi:MAG: hypothetical protein GY839_14370 [candidate division Zixibacteria bacterium]|nr:hypothetical protein [candidate division Zixibacteria bacterium]